MVQYKSIGLIGAIILVSYEIVIGQVFERLTVLRPTPGRIEYYDCLCICGTEKAIRKYSLLRGYTRSCGCLRREAMVVKATKHGYSFTPMYSVWAGMVQRCRNPKHKTYAEYGGRGITVCDEWEYSAETFCAWAEANGYKAGLELDRIDNNGNYEPGNCHFVTKSQNARNTRVNILVTLNGETMTIHEARERFTPHFKMSNIYGKYYRGVPHEEIFELTSTLRGDRDVIKNSTEGGHKEL